jgi:hypothetical protein
MREPVHFLPILTTLIAIPFAWALFQRWRTRRSGPHLLWWAAGVFLYGVGTFTEASVTLFGWSEGLFRAWYISGALLGGAPLAQGSAYLLLERRTAHVLAWMLITFIAIAATFVLLSPIDMTLVEPHRLSGSVLEWQRVRLFSPFVNTYAVIFLIGGAIWSAVRFYSKAETHHRAVGNTFIAVGAILPGVGGAATRMGHTEVLYVMELIGLVLIWIGFRYAIGAARSGPAVRGDAELVRSG